ncbi:MAG: dTDP-4-dehydrorhamnose reductase [Halieaceae bacterium]|nr:dTDP-4-dehydrorhamnose reductase [Halieaceae bacterium]
MERILITGADGQLGTELQKTGPKNFELLALGRDELDIGAAQPIADTISQFKPTAVINAAAYTAVDQAEAEPEEAEQINSLAPGYLAAACRKNRALLIHISTDFVFDGLGNTPYKPDSKTSPLGNYGRTKLLGEEKILEELSTALIVRTSWVYSAYGKNFVKTMLRLMQERDTVRVVEDQIGAPTWARGLAEMLWASLSKDNIRGIYHWSDEGICSWYQFAKAIAEEAVKIGLIKRCAQVEPISSKNYKTLATRPDYSVLDCSSTIRDVGISSLPWRSQLKSMLEDLKRNSNV